MNGEKVKQKHMEKITGFFLNKKWHKTFKYSWGIMKTVFDKDDIKKLYIYVSNPVFLKKLS